ncbi:hypothetical protein ASD28_07370 [Massilia sp. Root133]|nr:hypothetical protein ASD28_07370 [Massilia sp. Root133]
MLDRLMAERRSWSFLIVFTHACAKKFNIAILAFVTLCILVLGFLYGLLYRVVIDFKSAVKSGGAITCIWCRAAIAKIKKGNIIGEFRTLIAFGVWRNCGSAVRIFLSQIAT